MSDHLTEASIAAGRPDSDLLTAHNAGDYISIKSGGLGGVHFLRAGGELV